MPSAGLHTWFRPIIWPRCDDPALPPGALPVVGLAAFGLPTCARTTDLDSATIRRLAPARTGAAAAGASASLANRASWSGGRRPVTIGAAAWRDVIRAAAGGADTDAAAADCDRASV